jgi:hypothetical protein
MELLIPGLILVALMVYASTRIKKTAAAAFDAEMIDNEQFSLEKPDGFLTVLNGSPELLFESYSKDFGDEPAENVRQARIEVRRIAAATLEQAAKRIAAETRITSKTAEVINERKYLLLEAERVEKGVGYVDLYKLASSGRDVLELKISALEQVSEDVSRKIQSLASSFLVK